MIEAISTPKVRTCHDPSNAISGRGINEDTETSAVPECTIGHVLRDVIWRIMYLYEVAVVNAAGTSFPLPSHPTCKNGHQKRVPSGLCIGEKVGHVQLCCRRIL